MAFVDIADYIKGKFPALAGTNGVVPVACGGTGVTTDKAIALKSYPVGAIYISYVSTSPASLFGGTWTQITNRVLRAANNVSTGGADTHKLTVAQMPSHTHRVGDETDPGDSYRFSGEDGNWANFRCGSQSHYNYTITATSTGGDSDHNNLPAYQNLYVWRRTA